MSLISSHVRSLELALINLEATLTGLGVQENPEYDVEAGGVARINAIKQSFRTILNQARGIWDFEEPMNFFSPARVTALDNVIRLQMLYGISEDEGPRIFFMARDIISVEYPTYSAAAKRVISVMFLSRLEMILHTHGIYITLVAFEFHYRRLLSCLEFVDNYINGRILNELEKQTVISGFVMFLIPSFMPDDMYTVFAGTGKDMYPRFREPLRANGYGEVVERLDRLFQHTSSRSSGKRKAPEAP